MELNQLLAQGRRGDGDSEDPALKPDGSGEPAPGRVGDLVPSHRDAATRRPRRNPEGAERSGQEIADRLRGAAAVARWSGSPFLLMDGPAHSTDTGMTT